MKRLRRINWLSLLSDILLVTIGALLNAVAVIIFMAPFDIVPGGVSGVAVILNHLDPRLPIGLIVLIGNIPIQILGFRHLGGWRVIFGTLLYIVLFSISVDMLTPSLSLIHVGSNVLTNALFGGIVTGIGGGLVFRAGGTQGGTSTINRILQNQFGIPLSTSTLYTDTIVVALAGLVFGWEGALYAMVALFVGGLAADYVLEGPSVIRTATIITDKPDAVSDAILDQMHRGVTAWQGKGMFTDKDHTVLFVTVSRPQVNTLRNLVCDVDPDAFVVIGQGHIAYGRGFRRISS